MLDFISHMTQKNYFEITFYGMFLPCLCDVIVAVNTYCYKNLSI